MSERKVLNKYYPPDFDPSKIPRLKKKSKQNDVRIMAPFNMRCSKCGEYLATGTKFNAKKETSNEKYNDVPIYRFFIKCTRCANRIIFRTNPKNKNYEVEEGATENFKALKDEQREAEEAAEAEEEEEKINPMKLLENRTKASKQQMEASEQIQTLRSLKSQLTSVDVSQLLEERLRERLSTVAEEKLAIERSAMTAFTSRDAPLAITSGGVDVEQDKFSSLLERGQKRKEVDFVGDSNKTVIKKAEPKASNFSKLSSSLADLKKSMKKKVKRTW